MRGAAIDTMTAATSPTWIDFMATLLAVGATGRGDDIMAFGQCRFRYRAPKPTELPVTNHVSFIDTSVLMTTVV